MHDIDNLMGAMGQWLLSNSNLYIFRKDKNSRYIYCNEALAEIANLDSPQQIKGKFDHELIWHPVAASYQSDDKKALLGQNIFNKIEAQPRKEKIAKIITNKTCFKNNHDSISGVIGVAIEILDQSVSMHKKYYLSRMNEMIALTPREENVFSLIDKTNKSIAALLGISPRTVEHFVPILKKKFHCSHKSQLTEVLMLNKAT